MIWHVKNGMWNDMKECDIKHIFIYTKGYMPFSLPLFCPINMFALIVIGNKVDKNKRSIRILKIILMNRFEILVATIKGFIIWFIRFIRAFKSL